MKTRSRSRSSRRSPITEQPLRLPGQSLKEQIDDLLFDRLLPWLAVTIFLWVYAAVEWSRWLFNSPSTRYSAVGFTVIAVGLSMYVLYRRRQLLQVVRNLEQGLEGELAVGQFLDERCRAIGYHVLHDLVADGFNVDHVLIGRAGIFVVETKTISKPGIGDPVINYDGESILVDGYEPDRDPIAQARACAGYVRQVLVEATGRAPGSIFVRPVVVYPGWFIQGSSSGKDVWVLNPKALPSFLANERSRLALEDVALFHLRLKNQIRSTTRS